MPFQRGRPRLQRPPVRRINVEIDEALLAAVELAAGADPLRVIVEEGLRLWLAQPEHPRLGQQTPSDSPVGKQKK
jgi:hypothetical protein